MKLNKKQPNRTLHAYPQENDSGYLLIERGRYIPIGYSKAKWDEQRVLISKEELLLLVKMLR